LRGAPTRQREGGRQVRDAGEPLPIRIRFRGEADKGWRVNDVLDGVDDARSRHRSAI